MQLLHRHVDAWNRINSKYVPDLGSLCLHLFVHLPWVKDCISQLRVLCHFALLSHRAQEVERVRRECFNVQNGSGHVQHGAEARPFRLSRSFYVELLDPLALLHLLSNLMKDPIRLRSRISFRGPEDDRLQLFYAQYQIVVVSFSLLSLHEVPHCLRVFLLHYLYLTNTPGV